jgi:hypothetical protein
MEPLRKAYRNAAGIGVAMIASLFILFLRGGLYRDFYLLLAYSLLLQLAYFPRYGRWEEWVRSTFGFTG